MMRILSKKTHKTTTPQIITTMIILDIPEDSVAVGILVTSTLSVVVVSTSFVVMIFGDCVVETSKVSLPSVEFPFSATGTSGTRILKCSLSLKYFYFMRRGKFLTNLMLILSHFNNVASLSQPGSAGFFLQPPQKFCIL
uniref:Candidate secreted effector n=1 Tax=Meloidogyne incognita TaxID=6306 RepID=A0A914LHY4_MELIC